ncbi:MAG: aa3-type cytochrome c oxidase subunit IV [Rhodobacterales bacterium]|nr:aa3-type cytochrome c oxidase subunit IV [Rhodobacterales bacterium]
MAGDDHQDDTPHVHGTMDVSTQEKTFAGFVRMTTWGAGIAIGILIFMALVNA